MIAALLTSATFGMFLVASFILAITPGPGVIYVVTRTLRQGRAAGLARRPATGGHSRIRIFADGFIVALLNRFSARA